jgi:glycosyltransferase involved in cell wall biosynthesis
VADDAPYLLDVTRLIWRRWRGRHPTGVDRVCLAYLRHFGPRSQAVVQHKYFRRILDKKASQDLFALLEQSSDRFRRNLASGIFRNLGRFDDAGRGRIYLNVGHTGLNSAGFRNWVDKSAVRPVYFVHDLIPITHPEYCRAGESDRHRERMRTVLATAKGVIGNSRATLDELSDFARGEGLPKPLSIAALLGSDPLPPQVPAPDSRRATFVVVGTIEARKNHLLLLNIWSRLVDRLGSEAPQLLIIGQRGWNADAVFDILERDLRLRGHVQELNHCSDDELARHLASARALLFPSFAEGFGLPLVEALAMGVPVIASNLPVFREIGGAMATYLAPNDQAGWEQAITDYARPESRARAAQLVRISGFRRPDWTSHFTAVERWLATLG